MNATQAPTSAPTLPAALRVGAVELTVTDLERSIGFYESAIGLRLHDRGDARAAQRLAVTRTRISGASDHGISEAIYLPDPDGNGIELAADRGREHWGDLR